MSKLNKLFMRADGDKWAHPELEDIFEMLKNSPDVLGLYLNPEVPFEKRVEEIKKVDEAEAARRIPMDPSRVEYYQAPPCVEEPDGPEAPVVVVYPKEKQKKMPVLFYVAGGGMYRCSINPNYFMMLADQFGCVLVGVQYRTGTQAKYPAAINDLHAGYQWVLDNAKELGFNANRIVIRGISSGSHLGVSLCFRLKRYDIHPRGCIVEGSFMDNRPIHPSSKNMSPSWDGRATWYSGIHYLGMTNFPQYETPEMFPNLATPEECVGLAPMFIHADGEEAGVDSCRDFASKLTQAGVFNELHCWGGSCHISVTMLEMMKPESDYGKRYRSVVNGNIRDCFQYDLRRMWINDVINEE